MKTSLGPLEFIGKSASIAKDSKPTLNSLKVSYSCNAFVTTSRFVIGEPELQIMSGKGPEMLGANLSNNGGRSTELEEGFLKSHWLRIAPEAKNTGVCPGCHNKLVASF